MLAKPELDQTGLDLLAAADLIDKEGWCTNRRLNSEGKRCLLGAIDTVTNSYSIVENEHAAVIRLAEILPHTILPRGTLNGDGPAWKVANWNNYACNSAEEAATKLREAAYNYIFEE